MAEHLELSLLGGWRITQVSGAHKRALRATTHIPAGTPKIVSAVERTPAVRHLDCSSDLHYLHILKRSGRNTGHGSSFLRSSLKKRSSHERVAKLKGLDRTARRITCAGEPDGKLAPDSGV